MPIVTEFLSALTTRASTLGAIVSVETDKAVFRSISPRSVETDDAEDHPEEYTLQKDHNADYVLDFAAFMSKVRNGSLSALDESFENSNQVLELLTPMCSITPLLIDYGPEASVPFDINAVSNMDKLSDKLRMTRPSVVLYNLLGIDRKNMSSRLRKIANECCVLSRVA